MINVHQFLPTILYGDAVSNDTIALMNIIRSMGFSSNIYAEYVGRKVESMAHNIKCYTPSSDDIIIYHMSIGTQLSYKMLDIDGRCKILIYHNITPPEFFEDYDYTIFSAVRSGRKEISMLSGSFDYAFGDSEYNCQELREYGYKNVRELPILISYSDYDRKPAQNIIRKYRDGKTNILFVGRIAPNKKQEDIIKTFYYYKKYIDRDARLFLVGAYDGIASYYEGLKKLVKILKLKDVYFTGKVPFEEILAYYSVADVFLCMSEHEGFCVPLVESMYFGVPVVAYNSTAIPYTLGDAGALLNKKDYMMAAELVYKVVNDAELKDKLISNGKKRLGYFSYERIGEIFTKNMMEMIGDKNA